MVQVENGIPIPETRGRGGPGSKSKWPWYSIEVGQSFFIPDRTITGISSVAVHAGKRFGRKFVCRTEKGGVRVWRVA